MCQHQENSLPMMLGFFSCLLLFKAMSRPKEGPALPRNSPLAMLRKDVLNNPEPQNVNIFCLRKTKAGWSSLCSYFTDKKTGPEMLSHPSEFQKCFRASLPVTNPESVPPKSVCPWSTWWMACWASLGNGIPSTLSCTIGSRHLREHLRWSGSGLGPSRCCLGAKSCPTLWDPWTGAYKAPLSLQFPRQEYSSGLPFLTSRDLPTQGSEPCLLHWQAGSYTSEPPREHSGPSKCC